MGPTLGPIQSASLEGLPSWTPVAEGTSNAHSSRTYENVQQHQHPGPRKHKQQRRPETAPADLIQNFGHSLPHAHVTKRSHCEHFWGTVLVLVLCPASGNGVGRVGAGSGHWCWVRLRSNFCARYLGHVLFTHVLYPYTSHQDGTITHTYTIICT